MKNLMFKNDFTGALLLVCAMFVLTSCKEEANPGEGPAPDLVQVKAPGGVFVYKAGRDNYDALYGKIDANTVAINVPYNSSSYTYTVSIPKLDFGMTPTTARLANPVGSSIDFENQTAKRITLTANNMDKSYDVTITVDRPLLKAGITAATAPTNGIEAEVSIGSTTTEKTKGDPATTEKAANDGTAVDKAIPITVTFPNTVLTEVMNGTLVVPETSLPISSAIKIGADENGLSDYSPDDIIDYGTPTATPRRVRLIAIEPKLGGSDAFKTSQRRFYELFVKREE